MWQRVQQMLLRRGINTWLELVLWLALFYTIVGVGYASLHIELMVQLEHALSDEFSVFANIASLVLTVALWPVLLGTSLLCGVAGCGVF
ncbi:addiction module protein [Mycobacterium sp. IDR2000157661]|nr:addiction module protein [Mycobacterium sp. IDR2000157661]ULE35531.1 addiction module protein [Mycobacterium sp. IDR2000157661]